MNAIQDIVLTINADAVHIASAQPLTILSSAVVGGQLTQTRHIVNLHVPKGYAGQNPQADLIACATRLGITEPFVGMMTAASTQNAGVASDSRDNVIVMAVVTAGLSNIASAGITPPAQSAAGTINTILLIDAALTDAAMVNAIITATEAKTLTLIERDVRTREGHWASGTSTDSIVVACTGRGARLQYAGTATRVGWLVARTVRAALNQSLVARESMMR